MSSQFVLALDQGTTSSRAVLFDTEGTLVGMASEEFPQSYPRPGWVEHDPEAIWGSQVTAARRVLTESGVGAAEIAAVGITNQRETTLVWDRATGRAIANAIVWQCRRTAERCDALRAAGRAEWLRAKTGLVLDAYFSGTKLEWLLEHVPGARERAERGELCFGTVDTFLLWRATGGRVFATDPSNASRTLLYNLHTGDWDDEILRLLRVPRAMLPEIRPSSGLFGEMDAEILGRAIPIAGVAGDQQAALFGQACHTPGMVKNTYGTGCFLLALAGSFAVPEAGEGLLATVAWQVGQAPRLFAVEGSVFIAGAAVQWLRDGLGLIGSAAETEALARSVPDTGGVYFVPAFVGLGAPYWDPYARGTLVGLTRGTTRAHLVRAALEAICLQTCDVVGAMETGSLPITALRVDGGAAANDFLLQRQADLLGVPVERPRVRETTALGAAFLAGLAAGVWSTLPEVASHWQRDHLFEPQISADERAQTLATWRRAIDRARGWLEV